MTRYQTISDLCPDDSRHAAEHIISEDALCAKLFCRPEHVQIILIPVECAGRINKHSTGCKRRPHIRQDSPLTCLTERDIVLRPLSHCFLVLTEHTLTRTWHVRQYDIEISRQRRECIRIIRSNDYVRVAPQCHIGSKDAGPSLHHLIGHEYEPVAIRLAKRRGKVCGLTSRSCTKIQHP